MRVTLIGTGLMGRPLAERLVDAEHRLTVWNRTRAKTAPLEALGARVADDPRAAFEASEVVLLVVADAAAIEAVLDQAGDAVAGRTLVQMGTIGPAESRALRDRVHAAGGRWVEAPVLGSRGEAAQGTLLVMIGGDPSDVARVEGLLRRFGPEPRRVGDVGQAAALKLALNQIIASHITGFSLALGLVRRSGVDRDLFLELLRASALWAPAFGNKLPRLATRSYDDPNFPAELLAKDLDLVRAAAGEAGLETGVVEAMRAVVERALEAGLGRGDYSAVYELIDPAE